MLLSSCASTGRKSAAAREPGVLLDETEYEKVYYTGSNLPVLVPKAGTARPLPTTSPISTMSPEAFREAMAPGRTPVRR
jgi:hypothetical protein